MPVKPKTIKELKEQRRKENFVGRSEQQQLFLDNFNGDEVKWVVLSVTGEGGVGKSTLLKRYTQLAQGEDINANVVYCDDRQYTPVDAMAVIAEQLEKQGIESKKFNERYKKYRETLQQIESDPTAPRGMVNVVTRGLTDFTIKSLRRLPGVGVAADYVDEKAAGDAMADLAQYALTRWGNKDEVLLVREPEKILTPLFVELINEATEKKRLIVMFDVFERTASTLSSWIIELVDSKYGDLGLEVSFIVSGRDSLEQHWTELAGLMAHVQLEPFTEDETAIYLSNQDIKDETLVKQIHEDTGGLPVLVELLASTKPQPGTALPDISKDAVERFLQWTPDEEKRQAALVAACPRQFNQELLQAILGQDKGKELFHWLADQSFVRSNTERGYFYHDKVRVLMLRHQKNTTPGKLAQMHTALSDHFTKMQASMALQEKNTYGSRTWLNLELERIYHHLSSEPEKQFTSVLDSFLSAFLYNRIFSLKLTITAFQATADSQCNLFDKELKRLEQLVEFLDKNDFLRLKNGMNELQSILKLSSTSQSICFSFKGYCSLNLKEHEEALKHLSRAIELNDKFTWALTNRGDTYRLIKRYDEALVDLSHAIELDKDNAKAIALRGEIYSQTGNHEKALTDFNRAIELDEKFTWAIVMRGINHESMNNHKEALADFNHAIELDENGTGEFAKLVRKYLLAQKSLKEAQKNLEEAQKDYEEEIQKKLAEFSHAIELDGNNIDAITSRGGIYHNLERYEEALVDFTHAIELDKNNIKAITRRGVTYQQMGRYEEALMDFTCIIKLDEKDALAIAHRGETYRQMGRFEEALADINRAIKLDEKNKMFLNKRSEIFRVTRQYQMQLSDLELLISLGTVDNNILFEQAEALRRLGHLADALDIFDRIINSLQKKADIHHLVRRATVHKSMRNLELAKADIEKALNIPCKDVRDHYNRACVFLVSDNIAEALVEFELAFKEKAPRDFSKSDDLLDPIRELPEYKLLLERH